MLASSPPPKATTMHLTRALLPDAFTSHHMYATSNTGYRWEVLKFTLTLSCHVCHSATNVRGEPTLIEIGLVYSFELLNSIP